MKHFLFELVTGDNGAHISRQITAEQNGDGGWRAHSDLNSYMREMWALLKANPHVTLEISCCDEEEEAENE